MTNCRHFRVLRRFGALFAFALGFAGPAAGNAGLTDLGRAVFSEVERKIIRDYYRNRWPEAGRERLDDGDGRKAAKGKDKGKGKHKGLPPGIAKKLERGGTLPPGIARQQFPSELENRLPPVRDGYERALVDGRVALIDIASQEIVDLLDDAASTITTSGHADPSAPEPAVDRSDPPARSAAPDEDKSWWQFWK